MKKIFCLILLALSPLTSNASLTHEEFREEEIRGLRFALQTQVPNTREAHNLIKALERLNTAHINERTKPHGIKRNLQLQEDSRSVKGLSH